MKQEISVDKAINKGHLIVNIPVFVTMFGIPILGNYLSTNGILPSWVFGFSILAGFVLAWLVWSIIITKWRIWAFKNVQNVHELKKELFKKNSFGVMEVFSKKQKLKRRTIKNSF